jgi:hypothetical protein
MIYEAMMDTGFILFVYHKLLTLLHGIKMFVVSHFIEPINNYYDNDDNENDDEHDNEDIAE